MAKRGNGFFSKKQGEKNVYKSYGFTNRFQVSPPSIPKKEVKKKKPTTY